MFVCCPVAGPRGDGQQRGLALPAGDREDQVAVLPQPDAGHEHREESGPRQPKRGERIPLICLSSSAWLRAL